MLDMLEKYGMSACKPIDTPMEPNMKFKHARHEMEDVTMYKRMVGSLIYLTITRPDLSYAIGVMSQFMQKPCKSHLDAVQRILRYVKATCMYGLCYEKDKTLPCMFIQILIGQEMLWIEEVQVVMGFLWEVLWSIDKARNNQ